MATLLERLKKKHSVSFIPNQPQQSVAPNIALPSTVQPQPVSKPAPAQVFSQSAITTVPPSPKEIEAIRLSTQPVAAKPSVFQQQQQSAVAITSESTNINNYKPTVPVGTKTIIELHGSHPITAPTSPTNAPSNPVSKFKSDPPGKPCTSCSQKTWIQRLTGR